MCRIGVVISYYHPVVKRDRGQLRRRSLGIRILGVPVLRVSRVVVDEQLSVTKTLSKVPIDFLLGLGKANCSECF